MVSGSLSLLKRSTFARGGVTDPNQRASRAPVGGAGAHEANVSASASAATGRPRRRAKVGSGITARKIADRARVPGFMNRAG